MTLTLYRSRWIVRFGSLDVVDVYEWSFSPVDPTRTVREGGEGAPRCVTVRDRDGEVEVVTPHLARLVEFETVDGRMVSCLQFHGELGVSAESVVRLAEKGERGFRIKQRDSCDTGDGAPGRSTGHSDGSSSPGTSGSESSGIPTGVGTVGPSRSISASSPRCPSTCTCKSNEGEDPAMAKKPDQPSLFGDEDPSSTGVYGPRRKPREDRVTPVAAELAAHAATNDVPPWMPPAAEPEPAPYEAEKARLRAICDNAHLIDGIDNPRSTSPPNRVPQHDVDQAGANLVTDVERAIEHIQRGSGATAIAILRRVRARLIQEAGT